jgi:NAD-dependent SIR2 family protein deacetylase
LNKTVKEVRVVLVTSNNLSKVLQPIDRSFYFPTSTVTTHFSPVLCGRFYPIGTVRADQVNTSTFQPGSQRIAVGRHVVDQTTRFPTDVLEQAVEWCQQSDLLIAMSSSLIVSPAADLPALTKQYRGRLVIINRDPTPLDSMADEVVHGSIGATLTTIDYQCEKLNTNC